MRISGMRWSLLAVVVISLALVTSGCLRKNKHYTTYSGVDPGMSLAQAKDYCGAIASSAKSGAKSAFQQAQNKKKKKRYWSDGMFVYEQEVSGGFAGGFAEGLAKGLKGNAAYSRVMKGCMAEQGYKLTSKTTSTYKAEPSTTSTASTSNASPKRTFYCKNNSGNVYSVRKRNITDTCGADEIITKAEYDRLKGETPVYCKTNGRVFSYLESESSPYPRCSGVEVITRSEFNRIKLLQSGRYYCANIRDGELVNSYIYSLVDTCSSGYRTITEAEYYLLKNKESVTATTEASTQEEEVRETVTDTVEVKRQEVLVETTLPTEIQSTKDKLRGLKEMLDEGLITEEEAAAKRAKILENL